MNEAVLGILYEHPEWFEKLFRELERRGIAFQKIPAARLLWDPEVSSWPRVVLNRMSPSAWLRGNGNAIFNVLDFLVHLENEGVQTLNGSHAFRVEISKARQIDLFRNAGVGYPKARVINHSESAAAAAEGLNYPVMVKPNIGGSGAGIRKFETAEELRAAIPGLDLGVDHTALVQEFAPAREGKITRIEVLNNEFLYAIDIWPDFQDFNLCPADACQTGDTAKPDEFGVCATETPGKKKFRTERATPPEEAIAGALALARLAHLDVGGIEFVVNDRTGEVQFYDINALSNFVSDPERVLGFDPTVKFVDYLEQKIAASLAGVSAG